MDGIQWLEWGEEAFELSKKEEKPMILDIFGSWCHWCHVMDEKTYSDADVIRMINEKFVPVRVDTDKRPDINERYNQGGWPSTVFLTSNGRVITGATYVQPREMIALLHQVSEYHGINEGVVGDDRTKVESPAGRKHFGISDKISGEILEELITHFDIDYGGFGFEPKFPPADALEFLLLKYRKTKDKKFLKLVTITLDWMIGNMRDGPVTGLLDNMEGGFFRYSVSRDWSLPHYEKMLEANAALIGIYVDGYQILKNGRYKSAVEKTISYIKNYLAHSDGGFYGSQDADGEDEYYGRNIEERRKMDTPLIDKTIYVNLNAMMVSAFVKASIIGNEYCRVFALKTIEFLWNNCYEKGKGMAHYYNIEEKKAHIHGLASDNIFMAEAMLDAYELTGNAKYLEQARQLGKFLLQFQDKDGGFFDRLSNEDDLGYLKMQNKPLVENSAAAELFFRLGVFLPDENHKKTAEKTLEVFVNDYHKYSINAARYALAIEKFLDPIEVVAVGTAHAPLLQHSDGRKILQVLAEGDEIAKKKGYARGIYVCKGMACQRFETAEEAVQWLEGN